MKDPIAALEALISDPSHGLPEEVFLLVSRLTPLVNVDLLVRSAEGTLLTWREDGLHPPCWHVPGGIIRFKETSKERISQVARQELGTAVSFKEEPLAIREMIHPTRAVRGHFVALLYECALLAPPDPQRRAGDNPKPGQWAWHRECPPNLIRAQETYRRLIGSCASSR